MSDTGSGNLSAGRRPAALADGTSSSHYPYSYLPWPSRAILSQVARMQMLTASQIRRLCYQTGTPTGREIRCRRHLARLTKLGMLRRFWGVYDRPEYIYVPASSKARQQNMHTLDIAELYVRLMSQINMSADTYQRNAETLIFDPEPWCHVQLGHTQLKPDFYLEIDGKKRWGELDRGTEFRTVLVQKMRRYHEVYEQWSPDELFPRIYWIVHDTNRLRFIENICKTMPEPRLFRCVLFDDAAGELTK